MTDKIYEEIQLEMCEIELDVLERDLGVQHGELLDAQNLVKRLRAQIFVTTSQIKAIKETMHKVKQNQPSNPNHCKPPKTTLEE